MELKTARDGRKDRPRMYGQEEWLCREIKVECVAPL